MFQVLFRQVVCAESTVWFSALRASSRIIRSLIQTHAELVNTSLRPSCVDVVRQGSSEIHHHINKHSSKTHHHINKLNFSFCWSSSRPPSFCNVGGSLLDRSEKNRWLVITSTLLLGGGGGAGCRAKTEVKFVDGLTASIQPCCYVLICSFDNTHPRGA